MLGSYEATGEIDLFSAPAFEAILRSQVDQAHNRAVFIDCSAISFMDSSAFHALVRAHRYAIDQDRRLVVGNLTPNCARTLRLCDWNNELTIDALMPLAE